MVLGDIQKNKSPFRQHTKINAAALKVLLVLFLLPPLELGLHRRRRHRLRRRRPMCWGRVHIV